MEFHLENGQVLNITLPNAINTGVLTARAKHIWENWQRLRLIDQSMRSGVAYCGGYPDFHYDGHPVAELCPTASVNYDRPLSSNYLSGAWARLDSGVSHPESVGDHTRSCMILLWLCLQEFPALFSPNSNSNVSTWRKTEQIIYPLYFRLATLLTYHDLAEAFTGDIADDGSRDEAEKNVTELDIILSLTDTINVPEVHEQLIKDFINFQHPLITNLYDGWTPHDGHIIQFARLIDKVDACLTALKLESEGHPGDLLYKEAHYTNLSDRDRDTISLCGTSSISDCWVAHFVLEFHQYYGFDFILNILRAAVLDVRGKWFSWWDKLNFNLDSNPF